MNIPMKIEGQYSTDINLLAFLMTIFIDVFSGIQDILKQRVFRFAAAYDHRSIRYLHTNENTLVHRGRRLMLGKPPFGNATSLVQNKQNWFLTDKQLISSLFFISRGSSGSLNISPLIYYRNLGYLGVKSVWRLQLTVFEWNGLYTSNKQSKSA